MEYVCVVGGGLLQVPVIEELKSRGYGIIVIDRDPKCAARKLADIFMNIDTYDWNKTLNCLDIIKLEQVITDAADIGPTVSAISEAHNLPNHCSYESAVRTKNKALMRRAINLEHPVFVVADNPQYATDLSVAWGNVAINNNISQFPCVVKTSCNSASRGITIVRNLSDFTSALESAKHSVTNISSSCKMVVVEEYISGQEYSCDWLVDNGKVYFVNGASRIFSKFGIEMGHINPWDVSHDDMHIIQGIAETAVRKLNVERGPFKMDLIKTEKYGWCLLECATRWSGGFDHTHTAKMATGRDLVKVLVDYTLTGKFDANDLVYKSRNYAAAYAPIFEPGKIKGWKGENFIPLETHEIVPVEHCANRPVFVFGVDKDPAEAWKRAVETTVEPIR